MTSPASYRFAPRDRTGWVLGLSGPQVVAIGGALLLAVMAASHGVNLVAAAIPVLVGVGVAFGRVGGRPLMEAAPSAARWALRAVRKQNRWQPSLTDEPDAGDLPLPPPLDGLELLAVDGAVYDPTAAGRQVGVVYDPTTRTFAATFPVVGSQFALTDRVEQDRLLALWGDAMAGFCQERGPVAWVRWAECAAPAGYAEQLRYLAEHGHGDISDPAVASYRSLLAAAGPLSTRHEVFVTVALAAERVTIGRRHGGDLKTGCSEVLLAQLRLFAARLDSAGLVVGPPLSPEETRSALQARLDPTAAPSADDRCQTLAERAGLVSASGRWPASADACWSRWVVDLSLHRSYHVVEWPRLEVGPDWLAAVLLWAGAVRTVAVICEPVAPRRSHRAIERDATKLASDEEHRRSKGFRVSAHHRRAQADVEERESQLVSGYGEFTYAGIISLSAPDSEALERACEELVQVAGGCGLVLSALDGRHGEGVAACLPVARALAPSRMV
ncbi:MAG TPA: SCO6880 family protein [Acidimicrobiales bacterium]|nr:SCO6880 family protein [Acidimicrobiales bacterium]